MHGTDGINYHLPFCSCQAMKLEILLFAVCCSAALAHFNTNLDQHWELWKKTHNKFYSSKVRIWISFICQMIQKMIFYLHLEYFSSHVLWGI